mmetsp:Transcript_51032/g.100315  ORF Transcript_51032/g.100315 Transcript_51032/m.100315 type:complete len:272 (-) Transcript_51032:239-1054(-)
MPLQLRAGVPLPHIPQDNRVVTGPRGQQGAVPSQRTHSHPVPPHSSHKRRLLNVPNLNVPSLRPDCEMRPSLHPCHRRHLLCVRELTEFVHPRRARRPEIHCFVQRDSELVSQTPVDEVQVEVVNQVRGVEDFEGSLGDFASGISRRRQARDFPHAQWGGRERVPPNSVHHAGISEVHRVAEERVALRRFAPCRASCPPCCCRVLCRSPVQEFSLQESRIVLRAALHGVFFPRLSTEVNQLVVASQPCREILIPESHKPISFAFLSHLVQR